MYIFFEKYKNLKIIDNKCSSKYERYTLRSESIFPYIAIFNHS